jgi:RNA polymerase sigma-70 factor (ECF subfamily)
MGGAARRALFADLWNHYYPRLTLFVRRMPVEPSETEDAVQEIMLRVFRSLHRYRPDYAVSTWVYAIARNHCLDRARKSGRIAVAYDADPDSTPGRFAAPEELLLQGERTSLAAELLASLKPVDRQIALLRFYEELPYRRISTVMNMPVGTVKYRVHRIREVLKSKREDHDA